jgi:hypothetical protein
MNLVMAFQLQHFFRRETAREVQPMAGGARSSGERQSEAALLSLAPRGTATAAELRRLIPVREASLLDAAGDTLVLLPMTAAASGRMRMRELWECAPFLFREEVAVHDVREVVLTGDPSVAMEQPVREGGLWSRFPELGEPMAAAVLQVPPGAKARGPESGGGGHIPGMRTNPVAEVAGPLEVAAVLGTLPGVRACALSVAGLGSGAGGDPAVCGGLLTGLPEVEASLRSAAAGLTLPVPGLITMRCGGEVRTVFIEGGLFLAVVHAAAELPAETVAHCRALVRRLLAGG